jgi:hypothetical protein
MEGFQFQAWRVTPEVLERIKGPLLVMKDMHDDIRIISHHPLARRKAVDPPRPDSMILPQPILEFVDDRLQVRLGVSRAKQKEIREARDAAHIQRHEIFSFLIRRYFGAKLR